MTQFFPPYTLSNVHYIYRALVDEHNAIDMYDLQHVECYIL